MFNLKITTKTSLIEENLFRISIRQPRISLNDFNINQSIVDLLKGTVTAPFFIFTVNLWESKGSVSKIVFIFIINNERCFRKPQSQLCSFFSNVNVVVQCNSCLYICPFDFWTMNCKKRLISHFNLLMQYGITPFYSDFSDKQDIIEQIAYLIIKHAYYIENQWMLEKHLIPWGVCNIFNFSVLTSRYMLNSILIIWYNEKERKL